MEFHKTTLEGCFLIEMKPIADARGYFVRSFCQGEFAEYGLEAEISQVSYSLTRQKGSLRGLHFQYQPHMEDKLVRCAKGRIFDVAVDLRIGSPSFGRWTGHELSEVNQLQLFIPKGFAHGFQTLSEDCIVHYQISAAYDAEASAGVRWDDPQIAVDWPLRPAEQSARDLQLPLLCDLGRDRLMSYSRAG